MSDKNDKVFYEEMSFEKSSEQCAAHIGQRLQDRYGLTVTDTMKKDIATWIQEHFNADQI